jgi:hypothetical protein
MKTYAIILFSLFLSIAGAQVTVQTNLPASLAPGQEYLIEVKINKGSIANFAKYQIDVPAGVTVTEGDTRTGNFTFDDNRAKIVWVSIPAEAEFIVTFKMNMAASGPGTFVHKFYYLAEEGKKEVEFDPITVNFDASGAKEVVSMGGKATSDPNESAAKTTATITTSSADPVTNSNVTSNNASTEPVKTNNETVNTSTEPVKTNSDPVVKTTPKEETASNKTETAKPVETGKTSNTSSASPGLVFKVQIGAYGADPSPSLFKGLTDKVTVVREAGFYKALVGRFDTKEEAVAKINELKNYGFQGFLVRYQNGVRVK